MDFALVGVAILEKAGALAVVDFADLFTSVLAFGKDLLDHSSGSR